MNFRAMNPADYISCYRCGGQDMKKTEVKLPYYCDGCWMRVKKEEKCGKRKKGHEYAMIYNDGTTCLDCGSHREVGSK